MAEPNRGKRDDFLYKFSNLSAGTAKFANEWRAGHTHLETTDHGEMHKGWYPVERFNHPRSEDRIIVPNQGARSAAGRNLGQRAAGAGAGARRGLMKLSPRSHH